MDYDSYDVASPSPPPPQQATEPVATIIEPEILSDQEVAQQPVRRGLRICAWTLWIVLIGFNYKLVFALLDLAARSWPGFY